MNSDWDKELEKEIRTGTDRITWSAQQEQQVLTDIHRKLNERSTIMRFSKKYKVMLATAAIMMMGSITAIAAGKITSFYSSTNRDEAITSAQELAKSGTKKLGEDLYIPEKLADGNSFSEGYVTEVEGRDEEGNKVAVYPNVSAIYGDIFLDISKGIVNAANEEKAADYQEEYNGMTLRASSDAYLFLPPNQKPSEEDKKLEEAGELYISYGSSEEERKVFKNVSWVNGDLYCSIQTFGDESLEELMNIAKQYLDQEL